MKKLIAILLSAVLLFTSVLSASMFTVSADGEALTDNVKLAYWEDQFGNEMQLFPGMDIPDHIAQPNWTLTENTTKLPLTSLMKLTMPAGKTTIADEIRLSEVIDPNEYSGTIFYVEIPDFGTVSHTYDMGTPDDPSDDKTYETDKFRFSFHYYGYNLLRDVNDEDEDGDTTEYLYNEDGSIKTVGNGYYQYAGQDWFIRGVNDTAWRASGSKTYYGIELSAGFKGYVYVEFNGLKQNNGGVTADSRITTIVPRQLRSTTDVFYDANNSGVYYGYLPEGESLVMSEPIWIKGNYVDGASHLYNNNPDLVIDGVAYNLNTGKAVDYASTTPTNLSITKILAAPQVEMAFEAAYGSKSEMPSTSLVTNENASRVTGYRVYGDTFDTLNSMISQATLQTPIAYSSIPSSGGFLFHVDIPALDGPHTVTVNCTGIASDGSTVNSRSVNIDASGTSVLYLLKDGATSWEARTEGVAEDWIDTYKVKISDGTKPWSGYIFVPKNAVNNWGSGSKGVATLTSVGATFMPYRSTNKTPNTQDVHGTVSAPVIVSNFVSTTTMSYAADGKAVDLATGKVLDFDYFTPETFIGKTDLINNGSATVLELNNVVMKETPAPGAAPAIIDSGSLKPNAKYVESICPITKMPSIKTSGTITNARAQALQYTFQNENSTLYGGDIDGFMFYIKVGSKPVSFGFNAATYVLQADDTYKVNYSSAFGYGSTVPLLAKGSKTWTASTAATPVNGVTQIPANFEGYMYIPKFGNMTTDTTKIWRLNMYMAAADDGNDETTDDFNVDFTLGAMMSVAKGTWTKNYTGMAFVNGSKVAQNIFDGGFVVPNDMNSDMRVDLRDLVSGQSKLTAAEFTAFRANYLNTYFNDAEYSVLSAAFSVAPLSYLASDATTILSSNPDRGYRSEMVLYFASEPLKISDTPDYTPQLLSGTGYTVDVSANAIFDSDIASGKREPQTETDYNISNTPSNDGYPMGDGSGGAVHTVTVETLQAWINAHNNYVQDRLNAKDGAYRASYKLIQASGETLDNFYSRAAVHLVSNYMTYEIKRSDMFVNELVKVVYLNDDQKAQVKYTGAWSDRYFTIDGVERYIRVEGNASAKNFFYYDNAGCRVYNDDGSLKELKIHVYHDPRTIFASDSTAEWDSRLRTYFVQYKIGYNDVDAKTYYTRKVTLADGTSETIEIANNLFNAYLTFTEFAHSDEIPEGVLDSLDYFFKYCAKVGAKANFRPSYNTFTQNAYLSQNIIGYQQFRNNVESECADEATMIAHIKQMAPVVAANKDAIHNISSGWIGFGGEMAAGFQYPPVSYKNVITALLDYHCIPNGLYFSSRSSSYVTNIINGVEAVKGYNSGNLDLLYGLEADAEWTEKYAKWCGFNNDAFFGEQNFTGWGSGDYYKVGDASYAYDTANAAYTPNDGELFTNGSHVPTSLVVRDGKYVWVGFNDLESGNVDKYNDTDNNIPTPMEAILELAHHRYTDFSQWHGFLDVSTPNVMTFWMDHNAQWIFEGDIDSVEGNNALFNAEERAAEITKAITKADLEANGILYDPAYFANTDTVNAYEFIRDHLGYRLVAQDVKVDYNEKKSDKVNVTVNLKNYGFGAAFNMESTLAIFDTEGNLVQQIKAGDPSTWYNLAPDYYTTKRNSSAQGDALIHSVSAGFDSLKDGTYYVGIKLANSAGTTARLANDVELNEQGYNILGHFNFARLSSEPTVKETLKVMSYNIRCLRGGESNAGYDPLTTDEISKTISNFYSLLSRENPDVMIVCENRMNFDGSATSTDEGMMNVYDNLFKRFFPYAYDLSTGASAPRIYSKYPLSDIEWLTVNYDGTNTQKRRPLAASIEVEGEKIYIIACHPAAGAEVYESDRVPYFQSILDYAANKDNVIFAGDLNTDSADPAGELAAFKNAGFTLGNFGDFGTFQTYRYGGAGDKYLDNIVVKGLEMKNFWVGEETYSDHFPVYSEIYLPLKND